MKKHINTNWLLLILISLISLNFVLKIDYGLAAQIKLAWDPNTESDLKG